MRGLLVVSTLVVVAFVAIAPLVWSFLGLEYAKTVTITKPVTQTVENLVTVTKPVILEKPTIITVTSPVIVRETVTRSEPPMVIIQPFTITSTEHVYHTQTRTVTTTTTATVRIEQIKFVTIDQVLAMLNNATKVYAFVTYSGGSWIYDQNFEKVMNKLIELYEHGVEVKVLVHPQVCRGCWPYPPPGAVAPKLVEIINRMNKTLGYEHLRVSDAEWAMGYLTTLWPEVSLLIDGTKMVVLDCVISTGAFVVDLPSELAEKAQSWFEDEFRASRVWNPEKVCRG